MSRRGGKHSRIDKHLEDTEPLGIRGESRNIRSSRGRVKKGSVPINEEDIQVLNPGSVPPYRGRPKKQPAKEDLSVEDQSSLFSVIKTGKSSLQQVLEEWIVQYKANQDLGLLAILQFFIHASGCKGTITAHMLKSMEHAAIITLMMDEFDEDTSDYPMIMSGPQWKQFRIDFGDFVQSLVKQCQNSIIFDEFLMDSVISLLVSLSDSQVRAFRHTATFAAMKLMTALVDVTLTVSAQIENTTRQYQAERQKASDQRSTDRLEDLQSKRQELEENMEEIKTMLTYTFKSVFVHRFRDIVPEIRAICIMEISIWMLRLPSEFVNDSHLKYIGWTMTDKVSDVRLKCLQALQPLYESEGLKDKLELFTSKFKDCIVRMATCKEYDVALQAVRLIISIHKHHREMLSDEDFESVYKLVFVSDRAVAQAAGEFLNKQLFTLNDTNMVALRTHDGKKRLPNTPLIRDLILFYIESDFLEHGVYLVDSLIDSNEMMKDWECMTDLLMKDPGPEEESSNDEHETILIELMTLCIKQAATGEQPVARRSTRKVATVKEKKRIEDDRERLTEHFIPILHLLLGKYIADPVKVAKLILIPQYFEMEIYTTSRQEKNLDALLRLMQNVVERHTKAAVLKNCAKTLEILCKEETAIYARCDVIRSTLIDQMVGKLRKVWDEYSSLIADDKDPDEDQTFDLVFALKRVAIFWSCHNLNPWNLWDRLINAIREAGNRYMTPQAVKHCISACCSAILWEILQLEDNLGQNTSAAEQQKQLRDHLNDFIPLMTELMSTSTFALLREKAYLTTCELLIPLCKNVEENSSLNPVLYEANEKILYTLNGFIQTYIFVEEEDEEPDDRTIVEKLHKRRNLLASYCKLIMYNVIPVKMAAEVFRHYLKYFNDFGDIIKKTLEKARYISKISFARTIVLSLSVAFRELHRDAGNRIDRQSGEFISVKELAKKFVPLIGTDASNMTTREGFAALHRDAILFAITPSGKRTDPTVPPLNLAFLEIASEFTNKLLKQDKQAVLEFLDRSLIRGMSSSRGEEWEPLQLYRNSLVKGNPDPTPLRTARRTSGRLRHNSGEGNGENANGNDDADSDHDAAGY